MELFTAVYVLADNEIEAEIAAYELGDGYIPKQIKERKREAASLDDLKTELLRREDRYNKGSKRQFLKYLCVIDGRGKRTLLH